MQDITTVQNIITSGWSISNPAIGDIVMAADEFDENWVIGSNAPVEIITSNVSSDEFFLIDDVYKVNQVVRLEVIVKPFNYDPLTIDTHKITFYNTLAELDRIIKANRYSGSTTYHKGSWQNVFVPKGKGIQDEPLAFFASQDILIEGY